MQITFSANNLSVSYTIISNGTQNYIFCSLPLYKWRNIVKKCSFEYCYINSIRGLEYAKTIATVRIRVSKAIDLTVEGDSNINAYRIHNCTISNSVLCNGSYYDSTIINSNLDGFFSKCSVSGSKVVGTYRKCVINNTKICTLNTASFLICNSGLVMGTEEECDYIKTEYTLTPQEVISIIEKYLVESPFGKDLYIGGLPIIHKEIVKQYFSKKINIK